MDAGAAIRGEGRVTAADNQKTARRIVLEVFNAGKAELFDSLFAADYVDHALPPNVPSTPEGLRSMLTLLRGAFPDLAYTIDDQMGEGDKVALRVTGCGTLQGEFMGMQPTGKTAIWQEMHWFRFNPEGKLAEHWDITDSLGMLSQLSAP